MLGEQRVDHELFDRPGAAAVGLSKSKVAELRLQFAQERILKAQGTERSPDAKGELRDRLVSGYNQILRPKLVLGRFRYQEPSVDQFVARLTHDAAAQKIPYALTGGPTVDAMQHFCGSSEVPVFLNAEHHRALRLLPDRTGPVVLLKPFGDVVFGVNSEAEWSHLRGWSMRSC